MILRVGFVVCLIGGVAGLIIWSSYRHSSGVHEDNSGEQIPADIAERVATQAVIDSAQGEARQYADNGNMEGALRVYTEKLEASKSNKEKLELLLSKANFLLRRGLYQEAIDVANLAKEYDSEMRTTVILAKAHEAKGDKQEALEYYQALLDAQIEAGNTDGRNSERWKYKVEELSS